MHYLICFSPKEMNIFHDSSYIKINILATLYERGELYQKKTKTKKPFIFFMLIQNRNVNIDIYFFLSFYQHEVDVCRKEQPFEIKTKRRESVLEESPVSPASDMETESTEASSSRTPASPGSVDPNQPSTSLGVTHDKLIPQNPTKTGKSLGSYVD